MKNFIPPTAYQGYKTVSAEEMAAIDTKAIHELGIPSLDLMEEAGRKTSEEIIQFIRKEQRLEPSNSQVLVFCGRGNNGGDGLVAARYLQAGGCRVSVLIAPPKAGSSYGAEVAENLRRAEKEHIPIETWPLNASILKLRLSAACVLVDAVLGIGASGQPAGDARSMIETMAKADRPVVSVDIPSGLDPDTGEAAPSAVRAALTLTLGYPKKGLLAPQAGSFVGRLKVLMLEPYLRLPDR